MTVTAPALAGPPQVVLQAVDLEGRAPQAGETRAERRETELAATAPAVESREQEVPVPEVSARAEVMLASSFRS